MSDIFIMMPFIGKNRLDFVDISINRVFFLIRNMLEHYIVLTALGVGTYFDVFNKKMVPDIIWTIGAILGVASITYYDQIHIFDLGFLKILEIFVIFVLCRISIAYNLWGGADARALMMMTVILPFSVSIMILSNAFLVAILVPIYLISSGKKNWGEYPLPFILFMYIGALIYMIWGALILSI